MVRPSFGPNAARRPSPHQGEACQIHLAERSQNWLASNSSSLLNSLNSPGIESVCDYYLLHHYNHQHHDNHYSNHNNPQPYHCRPGSLWQGVHCDQQRERRHHGNEGDPVAAKRSQNPQVSFSYDQMLTRPNDQTTTNPQV